MHTSEIIKQILRDMRKRKLRSMLAMFGIVWGTVSVILLLALGHGFYQINENNLKNLTSGTLIFFPGSTSMPFKGLPIGRKIHIKALGVMALNKLPFIKAASPKIKTKLPVTYKNHYQVVNITGVAANYYQIDKLKMTQGSHFFNQIDVANHARVAFIGDKLKQQLFGKKNALNQTVLIAGIPFKIIAVMPKIEKSSISMTGASSRGLMIPYTTLEIFTGNIDVSHFFVIPKNFTNANQTIEKIKKYFATEFNFNTKDSTALRNFNLSKLLDFFNYFFLAIQLFLGFCGAMTLAVGAVSVANMMFLIVTERTKEIGLRMSLGAKPKDILIQILFEALVIVGIAGVIGFLLAFLILFTLQHISLPAFLGRPQASVMIALSTILILALIGILAGIMPAKRAAKLDPVKALGFIA